MLDIFKKSAVISFAFSAVVGTVICAAFLFGPRLETAYAPVVKEINVALMSNDGQMLELLMTGIKTRQCKLLELAATVETKSGIWETATVYLKDPRQHPNTADDLVSRPSGGMSVQRLYIFPAMPKVRLVAYHKCHALWPTMTEFFELDLTRRPVQIK